MHQDPVAGGVEPGSGPQPGPARVGPRNSPRASRRRGSDRRGLRSRRGSPRGPPLVGAVSVGVHDGRVRDRVASLECCRVFVFPAVESRIVWLASTSPARGWPARPVRRGRVSAVLDQGGPRDGVSGGETLESVARPPAATAWAWRASPTHHSCAPGVAVTASRSRQRRGCRPVKLVDDHSGDGW